MGKRKERRLAAMSAAGRRVKLDLFAEPSGDLGGSFTKDEVGGDDESKILAGLPKSPSSSGQLPENPLLLLGEYSDDELDNESGKEFGHAVVDNSAAEPVDEVERDSSKKYEDAGTNSGVELAAQNLEQKEDVENGFASLDALHKPEEIDVGENNAAEPADLHGERNMVEQISCPVTTETQAAGDLSSGWKMVFHEESNSYYYWNTVTGETSWEVPDVQLQGFGSTLEQIPALEAERRLDTLDALMTGAISALPNNASNATPLITVAKEINDSRPEVKGQKEGYTGDIPDKEKGKDVGHCDSGKISTNAHDGLSLPGEFGSSRQSNDAVLGNENMETAGSGVQTMIDCVQQGKMSDLPLRLMRHTENLLGRLKSLTGSGICDDNVSKFMVELELRLHDMRSLVSYGSSMLPFWLHSEKQLKQLEAVVNDDFIKRCESAQVSETEAAPKLQESIQDDIKADTDEKKVVCSTSVESDAFDHVSLTKEVEKDSSDKLAVNSGEASSAGCSHSFADSDDGGMVEAHGVGIPVAQVPESGLHSGDDMDMDVEMEVEDAIPASSPVIGDALGAQYDAPPKQPILPNPLVQHESVAMEEGFGVPPPPDDDWIPPPPPDDEPFPPPPPDEPPEASFPPPPSEFPTAQPFSYAEQFNLTFPGSSFEYYGQTNSEVPSSSYYVDVDGCQTVAPLPQLYYGAVPNTYTGGASVVVDSVEPVAYYALQDGSLPTAPVVNGVATSGLHSVSVHGSVSSDQIATTEGLVGFTPLPIIPQVNVPAVGGNIEESSLELPSVPVSSRAPASNFATHGFPLASTPVVDITDASTETVPKVQPKVSRSKKRTVSVVSTLRSNKKVSGLVDKWKAAKEELHEDEDDEPENAYEFLEKKRQREIEEWRAQQIATGEAKDNANFQPLGGDWRERVKRKKAKMMSEAEKTPQEDLTNGSQQPDLNKLSSDLPSGWQAYWDETSKQVYYGNSATSETTWIRPTS